MCLRVAGCIFVLDNYSGDSTESLGVEMMPQQGLAPFGRMPDNCNTAYPIKAARIHLNRGNGFEEVLMVYRKDSQQLYSLEKLLRKNQRARPDLLAAWY